MIVLRRASAFNSRTFAFLKGTTPGPQAFLEYSLYRSTHPYVRSFASSRRVANKSKNDSGDTNQEDKTYMEDKSFAGPFDTQREAMLNIMGMKDWTVRVVTLENGIEAVEAGGRIKSYLHPHRSGGIKDRQVDKRLVDDFGAWSIDELSEGELAEYLAEDCNPSYITTKQIGDKWFVVPASEDDDLDEEDDMENEEKL